MIRWLVFVGLASLWIPSSAFAQTQPPVPPPIIDPTVKPTNFDVPPPVNSPAMSARTKLDLSSAKQAGLVAARVGDEIITVQEVVSGMRERLKDAPPEQANDPRVRLQVAPMVLDDLIDRAIVLREAKLRLGKNEKAMKTFNEASDARWKADEIPPLLRKYKVENEYALKRSLALEGRNIDDMKDQFRKQTMFIEFLVVSVRPKLSVSLADMLKYYNAHVSEFDRGALITWREIAIDYDKSASPAIAKAKAETIHAGLKRGADFATLAESQSDGPTAKQGGKWQTAPGSIAEAVVAQALETLPINEVSEILQGKSGYHIVTVEGRRAAGPARFAEVQDQVREKVFDEKKRTESTAFIQKLSSKTMVVTSVPGSRYAKEAANPPQ